MMTLGYIEIMKALSDTAKEIADKHLGWIQNPGTVDLEEAILLNTKLQTHLLGHVEMVRAMHTDLVLQLFHANSQSILAVLSVAVKAQEVVESETARLDTMVNGLPLNSGTKETGKA